MSIKDLVKVGQVWQVEAGVRFRSDLAFKDGEQFTVSGILEIDIINEYVLADTEEGITVCITQWDIDKGFISLTEPEFPTTLHHAYNNLINKFKEDVLEIVDAHVSKLHTDFAPYLQQDTDYNVSHIASTLVNKLVRGDFERHNESSVVVKDDNGIGTYIRMTSHQYDNLRKNLIEVMPECPKDLEIESLKEQLKRAYERNY